MSQYKNPIRFVFTKNDGTFEQTYVEATTLARAWITLALSLRDMDTMRLEGLIEMSSLEVIALRDQYSIALVLSAKNLVNDTLHSIDSGFAPRRSRYIRQTFDAFAEPEAINDVHFYTTTLNRIERGFNYSELPNARRI